MFEVNNAFENIKALIKNELQNEFDKNCENNLLRNKTYAYFDACYNQAVFRFLYNIYIKTVPYKSLWSFVTHYLKFDDDEYKKYKRTLSKLRENQVAMCILNRDFLQLDNLLQLAERKDYRVPEYMLLQFEIMLALDTKQNEKSNKESEYGLKSILYKEADGSVAKTKNYTNDDYIHYLQLYNLAYKIIQSKAKNNFIKCLQYYHLEIGHRFETFYKFYATIKELNISIDKNKKYSEFKVQISNLLSTQSTQGRVLQNTIITDVDLMTNEFKNNPSELKKIIAENRKRNVMVLNAVETVSECTHIWQYWYKHPYINSINELINCENAESFFKNYIGDGQHITQNKNFEKDIEIKYFRRIYG